MQAVLSARPLVCQRKRVTSLPNFRSERVVDMLGLLPAPPFCFAGRRQSNADRSAHATSPSPKTKQATIRPPVRAAAPRRASSVTAAALSPHMLGSMTSNVMSTLAEGAPGSVDAPVWAIALGAVVVTAGALLLTAGLKPGARRG
jgi:hypothetical protein